MILTARIGDKIKKGIVIDITVKNNPNHVLAPTWTMVCGFKDRTITWDQYVEKYIDLLDHRKQTREKEFRDIIDQSKKEDVFLLCYCPVSTQCHRFLAMDYLRAMDMERSSK